MTDQAFKIQTNDQGFSLLEILVALFLFSLAFLTFSAAQNQGLVFLHSAERQFYARLVGDNVMVDLQLAERRPQTASFPTSGKARLGGYEFNWQHHSRPAPQGFRLHEIIITDSQTKQELARFTSLGPLHAPIAPPAAGGGL